MNLTRRIFELVIILTVVALGIMYFQHSEAEPPPDLKPSWPLAFQGEPLDVAITIGQLTPYGNIFSESFKEKLGEPIKDYHLSKAESSGFRAESYVYKGPILVETFGSHGHIDCLYADEITVNGQALRRDDTARKVKKMLGEPNATDPATPTDHYRIEGNLRLAVWYKGYAKKRVSHFTYYSGIGARQRVGGWGRTSPFDEVREEFPE